jgi:hypothetical protein
MPIVVTAIIGNGSLSQNGGPEFLDFAQRLARIVAGE